MKTRFQHDFCYRALLLGWFFLCGYVLASYLSNSEAGNDGEVRVLFYLELLVLTFPLGFCAGLLASFPIEIALKAGVEMPASIAQFGTDLLTWLFMVVTGFFQWFVWVPKLLGWIKSVWGNRVSHR